MDTSIAASGSAPDLTVRCAPIETPIGRLFVAFDGITVLAAGRRASAVEASIRARFGRPIHHVPALPVSLADAIAEHSQWNGRSVLRFNVSDRPAFDQEVFCLALTIPRGEVRTYGWIARQLGMPRAAKDVGAALGQNPILYLIPCHRVVYRDGRLGGYLGGSRAKRALLLAEGVELAAGDDSKVSTRMLAASVPGEGASAQLALVG
jgi:O-6-methylguanine DNA methyltransferase